MAFCNIKLGALQESASSSGLGESVREIRKHIEQVIGDTRSLTFELSPPILHELGFEAAVEWLAEQVQSENGITSDFEDDGQPKPLNKDILFLLFRAVRELLVNVVKHAQARHVKISIQRDENDIKVIVIDDGIGFDPTMTDSQSGITRGFGLFSIRERLDHIGKRLEIESQPGQGTRVTLVAPLS